MKKYDIHLTIGREIRVEIIDTVTQCPGWVCESVRRLILHNDQRVGAKFATCQIRRSLCAFQSASATGFFERWCSHIGNRARSWFCLGWTHRDQNLCQRSSVNLFVSVVPLIAVVYKSFSSRGQGSGRYLAQAFVHFAPDLGYRGAIFNLVLPLMSRVYGYGIIERVGIIQGAGRLKSS